jgi:DNA polymerase III epsilon subunit-like protein
MYEKERYSTLVRGIGITAKSMECNKITADMVKDAPTFDQVADNIFKIMDGKIWVGHNIKTFDIPEINKHFERIKRDPPLPKFIVDTRYLIKRIFPFTGSTFNY